MKDNSELIQGFLESHDALIVDSNSSARVSLTGTLIKLGAKRHKLSLVGTMDEARAEIDRIKPRIIFCDYMIGKESGLDLIQEQKQRCGQDAKDYFFVLVTGNGSQSAVARAAEEDVDTFVIKPYTLETFRMCMGDALAAKLNPSEYAQKIEQGKKSMRDGKLDDAINLFEAAKKLSSKPTLACFYLGQTEQMKQELQEANGAFREGLRYDKIHYKCLVGLFDLLMKEEKFTQAYDVVKKIAQYFPANPKRLSSVIRLAILTKNYDDIEAYYRLFTRLDNRTDELVRYVCSALAITGKFYFGQGTRSRALELFDKVATISAGRIKYMRYAIETMVEYDALKEAAEYLKRFPAEYRGRPDYLLSSLAVAGGALPSGEVIQLARDLIRSGIAEPLVYHVYISHLVKAGKNDEAEHEAQTASQKWPDLELDFLSHFQFDLNKTAR
jgi:CheY-like chemotaxis protein